MRTKATADLANLADLEEAIQMAREAIDATPKDHPNWAGCLNTLAVQLGNRYSRMRTITDLEEATQIGREAIEAIPEDHPDRAGWLHHLGARLWIDTRVQWRWLT